MNEQIKWALSILQREIVSGFFGSITIHVQNGKIQNSEIKTYEKPPI
jgi:hypothetical protein